MKHFQREIVFILLQNISLANQASKASQAHQTSHLRLEVSQDLPSFSKAILKLLHLKPNLVHIVAQVKHLPRRFSMNSMSS